MPRRRALLRWAERTTRRSSKMITTPNFATSTGRWNPSRPSMRTAGWCTWLILKDVLPVGPPRLRCGAPAAGRADRRAETAHRLASADRDADRSGWLHKRGPARQAHPAQQARLRRASPHPCRGALRAAGLPLTARSPNAGLHVAAVLQEGLSEEEVLQAAADMAWSHPACTTASHEPSAIRPLDRIRCGSAPPAYRSHCAHWAVFSPPKPQAR